jgi:hypothetical protein
MTSTWDSLDIEAEQVAITTNKQAFEICSLLKNAISALADGFTEAEIKDSESTCAQQGLYSQNMNSLKCSTDLAMRGYYTQSTGLLRGVYENWIAFHYLAAFPIKAEFWLNKDLKPPKHSEMLNALGPDFVESKAEARGWYGALCRFAHTDSLVVLPHLGSYKGEQCAFIGAKYKPDLFRTCAYTISLFTSIMLREISKMISPNSGWQQRFMINVEALLQFIENENIEFKRNDSN